MSKADFIHPDWQERLRRAANVGEGFANLEAQFLQFRSSMMASYEELKAEVQQTLDSVKAAVVKIAEINSELKAAKDALAAGQTVDYSELTASLDAAQAEIAEAIKPAEALPPEVPAPETPG